MVQLVTHVFRLLFFIYGTNLALYAHGQLPRSSSKEENHLTGVPVLLEQQKAHVNADRLAVVYLVTDLLRRDRDRPAMLRASVQLCIKNLLPSTPTTIYIFTNDTQVDSLRQSLGAWLLPNVFVMPLESHSWAVPHSITDKASWHGHFSAAYRLMGDWRLSYMPEFVRKMGHRYLLQLDDDSYILSPVTQNLNQLFDTRQYVLGARHVRHDPLLVTWGLPELARYYLTTHKIKPATLFEHCDPPNIQGLYSEFRLKHLEEELAAPELNVLQQLGLPERGGWNRTILFGNCLMYSLEWWFRPEVSRFVALCRASGGSFAYRWNEQGVIAMLWQIFVPREQFHVFEFEYEHRASAEDALRKAGVIGPKGSELKAASSSD